MPRGSLSREDRPVSVETTGDPLHPNYVTRPTDDPWLRQKGGLFLGQRSDAAFAAVNMARRWYTTYDPAYGRKVYPFIREVAEVLDGLPEVRSRRRRESGQGDGAPARRDCGSRRTGAT